MTDKRNILMCVCWMCGCLTLSCSQQNSKSDQFPNTVPNYHAFVLSNLVTQKPVELQLVDTIDREAGSGAEVWGMEKRNVPVFLDNIQMPESCDGVPDTEQPVVVVSRSRCLAS